MCVYDKLATCMKVWRDMLGLYGMRAACCFKSGAQCCAVLLLTGILVCHGLLNTIGTKLAALLNGFSSVWHMVGTLVIVIVLLAVAPTHQSGSFVFGTFYGVSEVTSGITNNG